MGNQLGTMVWCQTCTTVVWALDTAMGDLRGAFNMLKLPCRLCAAEGNYDGFNVSATHMERLGTYDVWSTMRALAECEEVEWNPSTDNTWFDSQTSRAIRAVRTIVQINGGRL